MNNLDIDREQEAFEYENGFHLQANFDSATTSVESTINNIIQAVEIGQVNPIDAFVVFKELEKKFNEAKKKIDSLALEEAEKYGKSFERNNKKFTLVEGKKTFNFSDIEEWKIAKKNLKEIEEKYKGVWLTNKKGISALNEQTGEILKCPSVTISKSSIIVK